jgi:hypothetical protein
MRRHLITAGVDLASVQLVPLHESYLRVWREHAIQQGDSGDISAAICLQGTLVDFILDGSPSHDWLGVMDEHLNYKGVPIAYSEKFSRRLHKFNAQYLQSSIHAIHSRWWIEVNNELNVDHERYAGLILQKQQSDGLFYDRDISETNLRHRMKTELTMSALMALQILEMANKISGLKAIEHATNLSCPKKCPFLGYVSMEYYRLESLRILRHEKLMPADLLGTIAKCAEGLPVGWCDFAMTSKVDAYMGTAKRTQRDHAIHSPMIACYVRELIENDHSENKNPFTERLELYKSHLKDNPMDIPAFQMRDVPIAFGADITPIEVICALELISKCR